MTKPKPKPQLPKPVKAWANIYPGRRMYVYMTRARAADALGSDGRTVRVLVTFIPTTPKRRAKR